LEIKRRKGSKGERGRERGRGRGRQRGRSDQKRGGWRSNS
jgi:hypothetical protein